MERFHDCCFNERIQGFGALMSQDYRSVVCLYRYSSVGLYTDSRAAVCRIPGLYRDSGAGTGLIGIQIWYFQGLIFPKNSLLEMFLGGKQVAKSPIHHDTIIQVTFKIIIIDNLINLTTM